MEIETCFWKSKAKPSVSVVKGIEVIIGWRALCTQGKWVVLLWQFSLSWLQNAACNDFGVVNFIILLIFFINWAILQSWETRISFPWCFATFHTFFILFLYALIRNCHFIQDNLLSLIALNRASLFIPKPWGFACWLSICRGFIPLISVLWDVLFFWWHLNWPVESIVYVLTFRITLLDNFLLACTYRYNTISSFLLWPHWINFQVCDYDSTINLLITDHHFLLTRVQTPGLYLETSIKISLWIALWWRSLLLLILYLVRIGAKAHIFGARSLGIFISSFCPVVSAEHMSERLPLISFRFSFTSSVVNFVSHLSRMLDWLSLVNLQ